MGHRLEADAHAFAQSGERFPLVADADEAVGHAEHLRAAFDGRRAARGNESDLQPGLDQHADADPVMNVERAPLPSVLAVIERPVGHHAVAVEADQPDTAADVVGVCHRAPSAASAALDQRNVLRPVDADGARRHRRAGDALAVLDDADQLDAFRAFDRPPFPGLEPRERGAVKANMPTWILRGVDSTKSSGTGSRVNIITQPSQARHEVDDGSIRALLGRSVLKVAGRDFDATVPDMLERVDHDVDAGGIDQRFVALDVDVDPGRPATGDLGKPVGPRRVGRGRHLAVDAVLAANLRDAPVVGCDHDMIHGLRPPRAFPDPDHHRRARDHGERFAGNRVEA